jgi:uncharacterized membrane protein
MTDFNTILDVFLVVIFLYYGYTFKMKTPEFDSTKGLRIKRSRKNAETWEYAHKFGGMVCLIMGIINGIALILKMFVFPENAIADYIQYGIGLLCVVFIIPIVNWGLISKFGKDYFI